MSKELRISAIVILALAIVLSYTLVGPMLTDPATYEHTMEVLDESRSTVMGLSAASAAASAALSILPSDACTPIAEQLSEYTDHFLMILSVIYLEKYLLTILGHAVCYVIAPMGLAALLVDCFFPAGFLRSLGTKLLVFCLVLLLVIPTSVWVSDKINETYSESIQMTIDSASKVSDDLFKEQEGSQGEDSIIDEAKSILSDLTDPVAGAVEQFKNILNRFIEAVAVMIVTTCLIPILVIAFFIWVVNTIFSAQIPMPSRRLRKMNKLGPQPAQRKSNGR